MDHPLLALCMIARDEAHTIRRTLDSVRGVVDHVTVLIDSRSTDGTADVLDDWCAESGVPGHAARVDFYGFASARNHAMDAARSRAPWLLVMSADEVLVGGPSLRSFLGGEVTGDAFNVRLRTESATCLIPRLIRSDSTWRYEGAVHEQLVDRIGGKDSVSIAALDGCYIEHRVTDAARRLRRLREFDVPMLELEAKTDDAGERARALALLGQTHEALAAAEDANVKGGEWFQGMFTALGYYGRAAQLYGGEKSEEGRFAQFHFMNIADQLGIYDDDEMIQRLQGLTNAETAAGSQPRPEVWFMIAAHYANKDPQKGLAACEMAIRAAELAVTKPMRLPVDNSVLWRSYQLAAECARAIREAGKNAEGVMKQCADAGLKAGGPEKLFEPYR